MSKYHNQKVCLDGEVFDSRREAKRYLQLLALEQAGEIHNLRRQVPYELIPTLREPDTTGPKGGVKRGAVLERKAVYKADFVYTRDGETVVEDTKGHQTREYILKRKLMLWRYGIRILET